MQAYKAPLLYVYLYMSVHTRDTTTVAKISTYLVLFCGCLPLDYGTDMTDHCHSIVRQAVPLFSRALELYPQDADIHFNLGVTLQMLGMAQQAGQRFTSALECNPQVSILFCSLPSLIGDRGAWWPLPRATLIFTLSSPQTYY